MLEIRELNLHDRSDYEILVTHIAHLYAELFGASHVPTAHAMEHWREQLHGDEPAHWAFVGHQGDVSEPVVFATLAESFAVFAGGRYGIINELWVRSDQRSAGVGARMIDHLAEFGRLRGWKRIDVSAPQDPSWDRSLEFYLARGFQRTGRKLKLMLAPG
jgi:GNAT superfamily N-acetyltransferase